MEESSARDQIVEAAIRVIDRLGPQPSMDDIAREAGTSKPRLYRNFADRSDLGLAIAQHLSDEIYAAIEPDLNFLLRAPNDVIHTAIGGYAKVVAAHPNVFRFLASGGIQRESGFPRGILRDFAERLRSIILPLVKAVSVDVGGLDLLIDAVLGVVLMPTSSWLPRKGDSVADPAQFEDAVSPLIWGVIDGFLRTKGISVDPTKPIFVTLASFQQP